ncbi:hypothetical protein PAAG_08855 [Paracoccidioides lutzii Pb01]|uniref:GTPase Ras2p n=1 Tax=Paracoccidioides lutzii (strain ATCC MYA-826 / Pb01) TaxID=502779 RepID=C1HDL4_PARBA|nr:hypothetical protein PAAG_08855 [Paracoccidioides lutzii Pb01]EEH39586.2 hypothetical protein PAAG_08855 [Paracoccidioides lutzii Pb01]
MAETVSITICGDGGCGKSSITLRLVRSQWTHEYDPTIEDSYSVTRIVDGLPYLLALTDTAGQEEYRGLWASSNLKSDAFLLVYDITNASTLEALDYFMDMIDIEVEQRLETNARLIRELGYSSQQGENVAVGMAPPVRFMAGNKCDLKDERVVSATQGLEYARKRGCGFMETSAREMVNIEETFSLIVRRVVEARHCHYLQQFPTPQPKAIGHLSLAAHSPSQALFSPDLIVVSHADSHLRTPALTDTEKGFADHNFINEATERSSHRSSQWKGISRAISKRVRKMKSRDTTNQRHSNIAPFSVHREEAVPGKVFDDENNPPRSERKLEDLAKSMKSEDRENDGNEPGSTPKPWWWQIFCWKP